MPVLASRFVMLSRGDGVQSAHDRSCMWSQTMKHFLHDLLIVDSISLLCKARPVQRRNQNQAVIAVGCQMTVCKCLLQSHRDPSRDDLQMLCTADGSLGHEHLLLSRNREVNWTSLSSPMMILGVASLEARMRFLVELFDCLMIFLQ
jgi:hypothetical protein